MPDLAHLAPPLVWKHFEALCSIPRPSKHEEAAAAYVTGQCASWNCVVMRDSAGNVLVRKPATRDTTGTRVIVLQSHLDMVPQKNGDSMHDFLRDPIRPLIAGDWVRADDTTLGADNGIGAACALAILEGGDVAHGPVEALFTLDEETGMTGALHLQPELLRGRTLINLDTEDEHELCVGCAGGIDALARLPLDRIALQDDMHPLTIMIKGLRGGHSGLDINLGRANAIKVLARLLVHASERLSMRICHISAGSARNAIPREATAVIALQDRDSGDFQACCKEVLDRLRSEYAAVEPGLDLGSSRPEKYPGTCIHPDRQSRLLRTIYGCPNGVQRMNDDLPGLVETSSNLAIVRTEGEDAELQFLVRSARDSAREDLCRSIESIVSLAGGAIVFSGAYPGWTPQPSSPIVEVMKRAHHGIYGTDPKVTAVHAGLECGIIGSRYPAMDMVSCGPTIRFPHSPDEAVEIKSVERFWRVLVRTLEIVGRAE